MRDYLVGQPEDKPLVSSYWEPVDRQGEPDHRLGLHWEQEQIAHTQQWEVPPEGGHNSGQVEPEEMGLVLEEV